MDVPRLRMFAGPNGSGKSTIKSVVPPELLGVYLFDNSRHGGEHLWVAEVTDGRDLETKCSPVPVWFQRAVWDKITPAT